MQPPPVDYEQQLRLLTSALESRDALCTTLREEIELLKRKVQYLLGQLYGSKSEKLDPRQLELLPGGLNESEEAQTQPPASTPAPRRPRKPRKPRLPENLPTEDIVLDPEEVKLDPQAFECIGEVVTQELDVHPPVYFRRRYIRRKWKRIADRLMPPLLAPLPPRLIPGSYASPGILTEIVLQKYADHLPLHRQEQILRTRYGIELSRKTMCDWLGQLAWWLKPLYNHIRKDLQDGEYLQVDETPVRYGSPMGAGQGHFWVYHRPGAGALYEWHTSRAATCLEETLEGFSGVVQCDGYGAYGSYAKSRRQRIAEGQPLGPIRLAGCWAHVRRKVHAALGEAPVVAGWLLGQIGHLYRIEAGLREQGVCPKLREVVRRAESAMIARRIGKALKRKLPHYRPTSAMGEAIRYALSHWKRLLLYLRDGHVEIDNNLVENAIRPTALGKKNYLFIGHPDAGERSAIFYTLLESCKREGINPQEYLHDVLTRLPSMTNQETWMLTPANWAALRKREKVA